MILTRNSFRRGSKSRAAAVLMLENPTMDREEIIKRSQMQDHSFSRISKLYQLEQVDGIWVVPKEVRKQIERNSNIEIVKRSLGDVLPVEGTKSRKILDYVYKNREASRIEIANHFDIMPDSVRETLRLLGVKMSNKKWIIPHDIDAEYQRNDEKNKNRIAQPRRVNLFPKNHYVMPEVEGTRPGSNFFNCRINAPSLMKINKKT